LFNPQIDAVQRDSRAEGLAQPASFYTGHSFSAPPHQKDSQKECQNERKTDPTGPRLPSTQTIYRLCHSAALPVSVRVAGCWRRSAAILHRETSVARPAITTCVRRH